MADSDPISDSTPNKRRKLNDGKAWDSQDDSGDDLTSDDFHTIATLPLTSREENTTSNHTYITQPTQTLNLDTQSLRFDESLPNTSDALASDIQVEQSSPLRAPSATKAPPPPIRRAFASSRPGFLANAIAPAGTAFRVPLGVQARPQVIHIDDKSDDEDPPVQRHSSDEEDATRGPTSTLKYTNFKKGGRGMNSDESVVKESPRPPALNTFSNLLSEFTYSSSSPARAAVADDMASAYGAASRRSGLQQGSRPPSSTAPKINAIVYKTIDDINDYNLRRKVREIRQTLEHESIQRCMDALNKCHGNVTDAIDWLTTDDVVKDASSDIEIDELASTSPIARRGVAIAKRPSPPVQPARKPTAKQGIKVPTLTIAEKHNASQAARRVSQPSAAVVQSPISPDVEAVKPQRRRLQQGRKVARSPSPLSSPAAQKPPQPLQRLKQNQPIVIEDDSDSASVADEGDDDDDHGPQFSPESRHDIRLLKFFNECSPAELVELSAQDAKSVQYVLDQRPFRSLDVIRAISMQAETKSGKKSKARPLGDKMVDLCSDMWTGYDAVDELVEECERMAKPIQGALKKWGVKTSSDEGELQLTNLNAAHDSGIGTPSSSHGEGDEGPTSSTRTKPKSKFLIQPQSMNPECTLKDYQIVGLNWLNLLWTQKISCILADDMGLGKTCQVIAFLAHLQEQNVRETMGGVHLVVVPGSTLENWLREFQRFAPKLKVVTYYGSQSERREQRQDITDEVETIDVIVTTYDIAQQADEKSLDNKFLRRLEPLVCVYDEAQALRNSRTTRYNQLMRIPAKFRLLLTGTPVQNNLRELVSILAFIMPLLFKAKQDDLQYIFQHKATTKDSDHGALLSAQRIARARTMMTPFILRRKKHQVLDLPAKHSRVEYCDMTPSQANHYASLLERAHDFYRSGRSERNASSNILMALRKAAIHALLSRNIYDDNRIDKMVTELLRHDEFSQNTAEKTKKYLTGEHHQSANGGDYWLHCFCHERDYLCKFELKRKQLSDSSGKVNKFRDLVRGFVAQGDRILVFSQFTSVMDILESVLNEMDVKFMRLDGSTKMEWRQTMLDTFTDDASIPVFMLSTKAGGAGINLACANRVIIFDSGFNPQDDIQAENRAHRVGQTREVEVVRLVTRGTIEEQIHALGESKLALDEMVAGDGDAAAKQAEGAGKKMVEDMFVQSLKQEEAEEEVVVDGGKGHIGKHRIDLKDAFKSGLEGAGLKVASKQARF